MLFGRASRKKKIKKRKCSHQKIISSIFSCQTWLNLQMGLASMVRCNYKMSFLAANTQDGFGAHRDKKVPHVYNEIYCCIFDVVGLYFCWTFWTEASCPFKVRGPLRFLSQVNFECSFQKTKYSRFIFSIFNTITPAWLNRSASHIISC